MYFTELLPPGANDIIVVLRNDCHQEFTYEVDGIESFPVGPGDLHESKYDYLGVHTSLDSIMKLDKESYDIPEHLQNASCSYSFSAYPSQAFEDSYHTNKPVIYAIVLASLFVFTSMVFLLYDWMVERRQQKVLKSAQQSGQLVHSLYPKATLEKLYEEQEEEKARSKEEGIFLNYKDRESAVQPKEAIASLYPETTIFFADLAGFTKWSSTRTPVEVFQLLETLYGEFDKIADRRKVFKVETIGDCYVAVTGLPEPQVDHAVIMCKFASECMRKMNNMTAQLVDTLGEDSADLSMRVGMHSGPVTAGVLRGKKARFQLFGDTVNTASRMESNGLPNKIQVSQTTADALIARGRGAWLTPREEKVKAKGKGELQTYWVNCSAKAGSALSGLSTTSGGDTSYQMEQTYKDQPTTTISIKKFIPVEFDV